MRSTALTTVPSTGTTPIDIDVGQQNVSAVVIHNASYRVLTLTLSDGTSRMIGAQRSDVAYVRGGAFDGHVTLTPGTLVSAQTNAGSMWLDVYLSGEPVQGTYPAPCQNGMTAGNQQPRVVAVPVDPSLALTGSIAADGTTTTTIGNIGFPASGLAVARVFNASFSIFSATTSPYRLGMLLQIQNLTGGGANVGGAIGMWRGFVTQDAPRDINPTYPHTLSFNNTGGAATFALQIRQLALYNPGLGSVTLYYTVYWDTDLQVGTVVPSEGGGFVFGTVAFPGADQYIGTVF